MACEPCLHSRRYRQICPLVSGGLPGVLLDRTLRTVRHRAAKGEPVEVQHLQLTGLCPEHGAGAPGSSAGNVAAGSGIIAAHNNDDSVGTGCTFCLLDMVEMSIVKWIIFCNKSYNFHKKLLVYHFLPYYTIKR